MKYEGKLKFFCEVTPLLIFFFIFKTSNHPKPIIDATLYLVISTFIVLAICYYLTKYIPKLPLFSALVLAIFGVATILFDNEIFIKIKPTLLNLIFATILFYSYYSKKLFLKEILGSAIIMEDKAWLILSIRWALFFVALAILNEVIWRNFSTDFWVKFKVFGMMPISIIFTLSQMPFMMKHMKEYKV